MGVTFYFLATGHHPWDADARPDIRTSILQENSAFPLNCTRPFVQLIRAMCKLDPKERPTAAECMDFPIFHGIDLKDARMPEGRFNYDVGGPAVAPPGTFICARASRLPFLAKPALPIPTRSKSNSQIAIVRKRIRSATPPHRCLPGNLPKSKL
jgi:serine/threonine protein kinase